MMPAPVCVQPQIAVQSQVAVQSSQEGSTKKKKKRKTSLVVREYDPAQDVTAESWLSHLDQAVEAMNDLETKSGKILTSITQMLAMMKASVAEWASAVHENLKEDEKTYSNLKKKLRERFGLKEEDEEVM